MKIKTLVGITTFSTLAALLSACGGGDIVIDASDNSSFTDNSDNSVGDNSQNAGGGNETAITCASYTDENDQVQSGAVSGGNCVYTASFVSSEKPILVDITFEAIEGGAHVFSESLYMGQNYTALADAAADGIMEGGDGPTLSILPGTTLAFNQQKVLGIARGARIDARGTASAPITVTSVSDVDGTISGPESTGDWGGMVVMGFGFYNGCTYDAGWDFSDAATLALTTGQECSSAVEGLESDDALHFGGDNADDNSGVLEYFIVKHAGSELSSGDELNGITFGAVGSATTISNLEIYSNVDDGIEFFGGGADVTNYVALYVQDDSIDLDGGYYGTIQNALVIQGGGTGSSTKTGAHCVESDGSTGGNKANNIAADYEGRATINNLTCISSAKGPGVAGNGDPGAGINLEESHQLTVNNSIVTTAYAVDATVDGDGAAIDAAQLDFTNYCFQMEDGEDLENAGNGLVNINTTIFACADISAAKSRDSDVTLTAGSVHGAITGQAFLEAQDNVVITNVTDDGMTALNDVSTINILDGFYSVPLADMIVGGAAVSFTDTSATRIGAVEASDDWTAGWTYGLHEGQALWFE